MLCTACHSISTMREVSAYQKDEQKDEEESPEHEVCHQSEPFHSRLDDRRTYKDPARTTSHPMKLCDPCQRVAPIDNGCRARPELMHERTPDPYNAGDKTLSATSRLFQAVWRSQAGLACVCGPTPSCHVTFFVRSAVLQLDEVLSFLYPRIAP